MAKGRDAVNFHQSNCKKPRLRLLNPSHYGQSPKAVAIQNDYFSKKATNSRRKFGSDGNGNPNYGREAVSSFSLQNQPLTRSWPLDWRGYFEQGIKWDAPLGLDIGLSLWRLHTMDVQVERPWEFMAKGLDFGLGLWRLHTMRGSTYYILLIIFSSFLWTLNKVWPLNPMASRLGRP
jgi:hypothetical protein